MIADKITTMNFAGPVTLLTSAWSLWKSNWKILGMIAITPTLIILIGSLVGALSGVLMIITFLAVITGTVFSIAMAPALMDTLSKIEKGQGSTLKSWPQYKTGFTYFWAVLGLGILQLFMALGSGIIFIIPGIIVGVFVSFYIFARILDGKMGFSAFTESYSLVKGRWWGVFGRALFAILVYVIAAAILLVIDLLFGLIFGSKSVVTSILVVIFQLVFSSIALPVLFSYLYKMYNSLKATRKPDVSTVAFKKWLTAFLVIGIIVVILIPVTGIWTVFQGFQDARYSTSGFGSPMYNPQLENSASK